MMQEQGNTHRVIRNYVWLIHVSVTRIPDNKKWFLSCVPIENTQKKNHTQKENRDQRDIETLN